MRRRLRRSRRPASTSKAVPDSPAVARQFSTYSRRTGRRHDARWTAGFKISTEQPVVVIDVEDKPGTSASLYRRIADANVNVNLTYVATNNRLVVGADNIQKVKEALTKEAAPAAARR